MAEMRLFLAVSMTEEARAVLLDIQKKLVPVFGTRGRTRSESMHLTVKFLGLVSDSERAVLTEAVRESVRKISPFQLKLDKLAVFGKADAPRVVAVTLRPIEPIRFLATQVDQSCAKLGFQREKRPFSPHITIFRPKAPGKIPDFPSFPIIEIPVSKLILFQSELKPDGASYHVLESFQLYGGNRM